MSHYRAPPAVLPSLRPIDWTIEASGHYGSLEAANHAISAARDDAQREIRARSCAAAAPCPAFTVGPDLRGPRSPRPPRDLRA